MKDQITPWQYGKLSDNHSYGVRYVGEQILKLWIARADRIVASYHETWYLAPMTAIKSLLAEVESQRSA